MNPPLRYLIYRYLKSYTSERLALVCFHTYPEPKLGSNNETISVFVPSYGSEVDLLLTGNFRASHEVAIFLFRLYDNVVLPYTSSPGKMQKLGD